MHHAVQLVTVSMSKTVLFKQFSLAKVQFSSIWPIDRTLSGATTPGQSGPRSVSNEGVICIPQNSSITGTLPSNCLVSFPGHLLWGGVSYPSAKIVGVFYNPSQLGNVFYWVERESKLLVTIVGGTQRVPFQQLLQLGVGKGATTFPGLLHFTLVLYLIMLSVKQGGIKYHFLSLWYDSTWDWTPVSWAFRKHANHKASGPRESAYTKT